MNASKNTPHVQAILSLVLGLLGILFVFAVWSGRGIPFISSAKGALVALAVLGFAMCSIDGLSSKVSKQGFSWTSPFTLAGIVLGLAIVYVLIGGLTELSLPLVADTQSAFVLLAGLILLKWIVSHLHNRRLGQAPA